MSYISHNLVNGEQILAQTQLHWIIFVSPVIFFLASLWFSSHNPTLPLLNLAAFMLAGLWLLNTLIRYRNAEFVITNKRILVKTGWLHVNTLETFIERIESVLVNQTLLGRLFNYGNIAIIGTGGSQDFFTQVANPQGLQQQLTQQQLAAQPSPSSNP